MNPSNKTGAKAGLASEQGLDESALDNIAGGAGGPVTGKQNELGLQGLDHAAPESSQPDHTSAPPTSEGYSHQHGPSGPPPGQPFHPTIIMPKPIPPGHTSDPVDLQGHGVIEPGQPTGTGGSLPDLGSGQPPGQTTDGGTTSTSGTGGHHHGSGSEGGQPFHPTIILPKPTPPAHTDEPVNLQGHGVIAPGQPTGTGGSLPDLGSGQPASPPVQTTDGGTASTSGTGGHHHGSGSEGGQPFHPTIILPGHGQVNVQAPDSGAGAETKGGKP